MGVGTIFWKSGQTVIHPITQNLSQELEVHKVEKLRQRFYVQAGPRAGWYSMYDYRWDNKYKCWVHKSISIDTEITQSGLLD